LFVLIHVVRYTNEPNESLIITHACMCYGTHESTFRACVTLVLLWYVVPGVPVPGFLNLNF